MSGGHIGLELRDVNSEIVSVHEVLIEVTTEALVLDGDASKEKGMKRGEGLGESLKKFQHIIAE